MSIAKANESKSREIASLEKDIEYTLQTTVQEADRLKIQNEKLSKSVDEVTGQMQDIKNILGVRDGNEAVRIVEELNMKVNQLAAEG